MGPVTIGGSRSIRRKLFLLVRVKLDKTLLPCDQSNFSGSGLRLEYVTKALDAFSFFSYPNASPDPLKTCV